MKNVPSIKFFIPTQHKIVVLTLKFFFMSSNNVILCSVGSKITLIVLLEINYLLTFFHNDEQLNVLNHRLVFAANRKF